MISLFVGIAGSGKTLHGVARCIDYLQRGMPVITNLPLNLDALCKFLRFNPVEGRGGFPLLHIYTGDELLSLPDFGFQGESESNPIKLIWDECSEQLDSYLKGQDLIKILSWFRLHRHFKFDCELITQNYSLVQNRIRAQCGEVVVHDSGKTIRMNVLGCRLPPPWRHMICVQRYDRSGRNPLGGRVWSFIDLRIAVCYKTDSTTDSRFLSVGKVLKTEKMEKKLMRVYEKILLYSILFGVILSFFFLHKIHKTVSALPVSSPAVVAQSVPASKNSLIITRDLLGFGSDRSDYVVWKGGKLKRIGSVTEFGIVTAIDARRELVFVESSSGRVILSRE